MATFVLVHGAWHGGWCWQRVATRLRQAGHWVLTPTLTGLGERSHLLAPGIDLDLHIRDIVNVMQYDEVSEAVLCGHSYGGMVITGVADAVPERLASLVYLDAFVPEDGEAVVDLLLPGRADEMQTGLWEQGEGWRLPPVPAARFGVETAVDIAWVDGKCTPHPWAAFIQPISLKDNHLKVTNRHYLLATAYDPSAFHRYAEQLRRDPSWNVEALPTGHDAMVTMPDAVAVHLEGAAS